MSYLIMTNTEAQDIKSRLDIVEVVSRYVPDLQQSGANWKACCPFHAEKTPSFVVNSSKDLWYCYGACATGGDSLSFIQKMESSSFDRTLDIAAELAGVERQRYSRANQQTNEEHQRLLAINESASIFFQNELKTSNGIKAREYLSTRGISNESISSWELGFAPRDRRQLLDNLRAKGFSEEEIVSAGVAGQYDNGIRVLFSNRVMFPTRDAKGRLIGFGARAMGEETPKYLNTPKTELYEKRNTLYGLSRAIPKIRDQNLDKRKAIVVEGYMDVIASHAVGLEETVASNGTAITSEQMNQLTRYSQRIIFALDADEAGAKAALRGVASIMESKPSGISNTGSSENIQMMIATLPAGEDPDSLIKTNIQQYEQIIDTAKPVLDFLIDSVIDRRFNDSYEKKQAVESVLPYLAWTNDELLRTPALRRLARFADIEPDILRKRLGAIDASTPKIVSGNTKTSQPTQQMQPDGETELLALLLQRSFVRETGISIEEDFFEQALNKAVFLAWKNNADIGSGESKGIGHSDIDAASLVVIEDRVSELNSLPCPEYDDKDLSKVVLGMKEEILRRREQARLRTEVLDLAQTKFENRQNGADDSSDINQQWDSIMEKIRMKSRK